VKGKRRLAIVAGAALLTAGTLYTIVLLVQMTCFGTAGQWWAFHAILAEVVAVPHAVVGAALITYAIVTREVEG
jgi:hypothetical protein